MYVRIIPPVVAAVLFSIPLHAAETVKRQDQALTVAAVKMKQKNYSSAARAASESVENGKRELLQGVAELKSGNPASAAILLGKAATGYPLLADYALYYQVQALVKMEKTVEALAVNRQLVKEYPDSSLARRSLLQQGDLLFAGKDHQGAETVYLKFVEKYSSGSDALQASYQIALCRERRGDLTGAATMFRTLWLNNPSSPQATRAEEDLKRLAPLGAVVTPYTPQELFKRGVALYDQRRFDQALKTFRSIDTRDEKKDFVDRLSLRIGQCLLKSRRYGEAERTLSELVAREPKRELKAEASHLLARVLEKQGQDEEAYAAYNRVTERFPESSEADDALLDAAFVRKFQRKPGEAAAVLAKLLENYPNTRLKQRATWELGWSNYLSGNYRVAGEQFKNLTGSDDYRERALYWLGRTLAAAGDSAGANDSYAALKKEYPYGFYTLRLPPGNGAALEESLPKLTGEPLDVLPAADGYERIKALIALGLVEDASRELSVAKKKNGRSKGDTALARLYLETGNYNGAMGLFTPAQLKKNGPEGKIAWSVLYPKAFGEMVTSHAASAGVSPSLAFAVMRSESSFYPGATSPVGARGLMQLMPGTAAKMLKDKEFTAERLYEPDLNIRLGTKHLKDLLDLYKGNLVAVIASYNAGGNNVNRWLKSYAGLATDEFIESIPFGETRDYVKKVLATAELYRK
ncbi:MAG TPA: tetratricopeptide repeat protein, partial [Geobacteraceae bacterium]|nr:tetratricopeptide repeat protein [Geobacteraceae bacterium]